MTRRAVLLLAVLALAAPAAAGETPIQAEFLTENKVLSPETPFTVGILLKMAPGWHTYWLNPGDGGLATQIEWQLPEGFTAGPIQWPYPKRFGDETIVNYGYEGEVLLLVQITPTNLQARSLMSPLTAKVSWLGCNNICVPGSAVVHMLFLQDRLPAFAAARERLPVKPDGWTISASQQSGTAGLAFAPPEPGTGPRTIRLMFEPPAGEPAPEAAYFFPAEENVLDYAAPQTLSCTKCDATPSLTLKVSTAADAPPAALKGVLVIRQNNMERALAVETPVSNGGKS